MPHSDKEKEDEAVNIVNNIRISKKRSADVVVGDHTTIKGRHCLVTYVSLGRTTGYGSANPKTHLQGTDLSTQKKYEEIILQRTLMECFEPIRRRCLLANIERDDGFVEVFEEDGSVCDDLVPVSKFLQKDLSRAFNDGMPVIWVEILKTPYSEEVIAFEKEDD
ncbi:hypothetical protein DL96DRAFT_1812328 [Flagelloscypha sp. PMI_526]|nr:hypothetical protein DL96DRAFT_1812328 [Flagelloscypha sp. PMI_526]